LVLVILLAVAGVLVLLANMYLQSTLSQEKIERHLGRALKVPVKIQRTTFTPWGGVKITGVTAKQAGERVGDFLRAEEFSARVRLGALLFGKITIAELRLVKPQVAWFQDEKGKWRLPREPKPEVGAVPGTIPESPEPVQIEKSSTPQVVIATPEKQKEEKEKRRFEVKIHAVNVEGGAFAFFDKKGEPVVTFSGISAHAPEPNEQSVRGKFVSERTVIRNGLVFEMLKSPFLYDDGDVALDAIEAKCAGGNLTGKFTVETKDPDSPFFVVANFAGVELPRLLSDLGLAHLNTAGRLEGNIEMKGSTKDEDSIKGQGRFALVDGEWIQADFFSALGDMLGIEELSRMKLSKAEVTFRVDDGKVLIEQCELVSQNLTIKVGGRIKFGGKLDLTARLSFSEKISRQIPEFLTGNFQRGIDGSLGVDFTIKGTTDKPRSDLMDKITGGKLENKAIDLIRDILGVGGKGP